LINSSSTGLDRAGSVLLEAGQDASFFQTDIAASATGGFAGPSGDVAILVGNDLSFGSGSIDTSTDSFFGTRAGDVTIVNAKA